MIRFHYRYPGFRIQCALEVKNWLHQIAGKEKNKIENLNFIFVDDGVILHLNRQSLQHDYYTDILTFPTAYKPITGEIYISIDRVKEQAGHYKVSRRQELLRVMVHGLLHLCGYDDLTVNKKNKMTRKEDQYLRDYPG